MNVLDIKSQDTTIIQTQNTQILCHWSDKNGLISSATDLSSHVHPITQNRPDCVGATLPSINFASQDLIWVITSASGCQRPEPKTTLYKIESQKKYLLVISIEEKGHCKPAWQIRVQELVPKLDETYGFEYKIVKTIK